MADRRLALAAGAVLALSLVAGPASAAPPRDLPAAPEHDMAFRSGLEQYARGNYITAIATWESLLGTMGEERGYKVLYNLGLAYHAVGDITRAIERYRAFIRQVSARPDHDATLAERAADATKRASQLEASHGAVHVHAPKRGGLVLTRVGTAEPRAAGYVVWLAPGAHTIELFVGTDHVKTLAVQVEPAKSIDIETSPPSAPGDAARPGASALPPARGAGEGAAPRDAGGSSTWVFIGAGATIASVALPLSLFVVASDKRDDADALGPGHRGYAEARASYESWRTAYYVSYALPAALAVTTVAFVVLRPSAKASATVGVSGTGLVLGGTF